MSTRATLDRRTCFLPGTEVLTPAGLRRIESIRLGDIVIGGSRLPRRVLGTRTAHKRRIATVRLSNGEVVRCTVDHLWLTARQEWVEAGRLHAGQRLAQTLGAPYINLCEECGTGEAILGESLHFAYDDPQAKRPPQHIGCRSTVVPDVDWAGLGLEPPPDSMRASADGPVPSSTSYNQWLRDRPAEVQDEILGPSRAQLFRDGKSLRDMVRDDGSIVRIDELT